MPLSPIYCLVLCSCCLLGVSSCQSPSSDSALLESILSPAEGALATVLEEPERYRVQILYTQIDRDEQQRPTFTPHAFRLDESEYFYPASTVKFPTALMALEKLYQMDMPGIDLHSDMLTDSLRPSQTAVYADSTSPTGKPSIGHYTRKIFLVSDNDAYNRLYEFVGQGPLNEGLAQKGFGGIRLTHRLSIFLPLEENRHTNPIQLIGAYGAAYEQPAQYNDNPISLPAPILLGQGEVVDDSTEMRPKDFATKNAFPLAVQQQMMRALFFPASVPDSQRFDLGEEGYEWVYRSMGQFPRESESPVYPSDEYYDSYVKFLLYGDRRDSLPGHIRIFNKIGIAYGFVTENAYIVDLKEGVEYLLSATIYTNANGIFNDGVYEYETLAEPFMGELGRRIHAYEVARERVVKPDLSRWEKMFGESR